MSFAHKQARALQTHIKETIVTSMRTVLCGAAALFLATVAVSHAQPKQQWQRDSGLYGMSMTYGDSDVTFQCSFDDPKLSIDYYPTGELAEVVGTKRVFVDWSSEEGNFEIEMTKGESAGRLLLTGEIDATRSIVNMLVNGRNLTIRIGDEETSIPLTGSRAGINEMAKECWKHIKR